MPSKFKKPMTDRQALNEARRRWGKNATAEHRTCYLSPARCEVHGDGCLGGKPIVMVGCIVMGMFNEIRGQSDTWEQAFEMATKRGY